MGGLAGLCYVFGEGEVVFVCRYCIMGFFCLVGGLDGCKEVCEGGHTMVTREWGLEWIWVDGWVR